MSSEESGLKAGHPPAAKAGGMRVVTKHKPAEKPDADAFDQKYVDQLPEKSTIAAPVAAHVIPPKQYPDSSDTVKQMKATHVKPQPTMEKQHSPSKLKNINQPRK